MFRPMCRWTAKLATLYHKPLTVGKTQGKTFTFMMTERERRALGFVSLSLELS